MNTLRLLLSCFLLFSASCAVAQTLQTASFSSRSGGEKNRFSSVAADPERLSPMTRLVMAKLEPYTDAVRQKDGVPAEIAEQHGLIFSKGQWHASGLLLAPSGLSPATLETAGFDINSQAGDVWSFALPIDQLHLLAETPGPAYVALSRRVFPHLDEATRETRVDAAQAGQGLEAPVSGKGVLVGVIDLGFDPTHPAFRSPDGSRLRIDRAWYQLAENGAPPVGFDRGSEWVGPELASAGTDAGYSSHATHVAGIAAGSNFMAPDGRHKGVAPEADIIYAHYGDIETGVLDAARYMADYAASAGKPLAVNISLGTHIGPHDGSTLFDRALENLSGPGTIYTGSAGNSGAIPLHIRRVFGRADTIAALVGVSGASQEDVVFNGSGIVDIWADGPFEISLSLIQGQPAARIGGTSFISTGAGQAAGNMSGVPYSVFAERNNPLNGKHHILLQFDNRVAGAVGLTVTANEGVTLDAWNAGTLQGGPFLDRYQGLEAPLQPRLVSSDNSSTVGEIGGSARAVITVGAYTTTNGYRDIDNDFKEIDNWAPLGEIAPFSSRGPTADGRTKPDVTAPGNVVIAPGSSYDVNLDSYYFNYQLIDVIEGERDWLYLAFEGTSMSAPIITGVIALMLEVNPNLTYARARQILQATSRRDNFTGAIGGEGDQTWGWGKVDALAAVQEAARTVSVDEQETPWAGALTVYPNPAADHIQLMFLGATSAEADVQLINMTGQTVFAQQINPIATERARLNVSELPAGTYALRVAQGGKVETKKIILAR